MNPKLLKLAKIKSEAAQRKSRARSSLVNLCNQVRQELDDVGNEPADLIEFMERIPDRIEAAQERLDEAQREYLEAVQAHEEFAADPEPYRPLEEAEKIDAKYLAGRTQTLCGERIYAHEPVPPEIINQLSGHRLKILRDNRFLTPIENLVEA